MKRKKYLVLKKYLASDLLCGHGEQGGDAEGDPGGDSVGVQPEADPGDDDEHAAGHVDGQQVVGELPLKGEVHGEAAVLAWTQSAVLIYFMDFRSISRVLCSFYSSGLAAGLGPGVSGVLSRPDTVAILWGKKTLADSS